MKFKVKVTIKAAIDYTVEVDASSEHEAEDKATGMWQEKMPSDFQVNKGYITDWETDYAEQLTTECEECGIEYPLLCSVKHPDALQPCKEASEYCAPCGAKVLAEEKAEKESKADALQRPNQSA